MTPLELTTELKEIIANNTHYTTWTVSTPHLIALVNKVVADEREACAKVADEWIRAYEHPSRVIAEAIRARGQA
jgi:hypothetical protein